MVVGGIERVLTSRESAQPASHVRAAARNSCRFMQTSSTVRIDAECWLRGNLAIRALLSDQCRLTSRPGVRISMLRTPQGSGGTRRVGIGSRRLCRCVLTATVSSLRLTTALIGRRSIAREVVPSGLCMRRWIRASEHTKRRGLGVVDGRSERAMCS